MKTMELLKDKKLSKLMLSCTLNGKFMCEVHLDFPEMACLYFLSKGSVHKDEHSFILAGIRNVSPKDYDNLVGMFSLSHRGGVINVLPF